MMKGFEGKKNVFEANRTVILESKLLYLRNYISDVSKRVAKLQNVNTKLKTNPLPLNVIAAQVNEQLTRAQQASQEAICRKEEVLMRLQEQISEYKQLCERGSQLMRLGQGYSQSSRPFQYEERQ